MPIQPFICVSGLAAALPNANIDTDVIMPKVFLKGIDRSGLARGLFHDLRFDVDGAIKPEFVLNAPDRAGASILVVGPNFGCGSSREHAIWGMMQFGIRAVIGTSFAGIFADNALNNGLLLVSLAESELASIMGAVLAQPISLTIDLPSQQVSIGGDSFGFHIDEVAKNCLLSGTDRIGATLAISDQIRAFERGYFGDQPWLLEENRG